jgi:hypothetical protein
MPGMSKKKPPRAGTSRHGKYRPHHLVRVPESLYEIAEAIGREEDRTATQVIRHLIQEALRARGRWHPPAGPGSST